MQRLYFLLVFILFSGISVFAQNELREYQSHRELNSGIEILTSDGKYLLKLYNESIIETSFVPKGEVYKEDSHAVVLEPEKLKTDLLVTHDKIELRTEGISVTIDKAPFQISYSYKKKPLFSEKLGYIKKDSSEVLDFNIDSDEKLYGGGARVLGMNRRGNRLELYNRAHYGYETHSELMNYTMPLVLSSKLYAVHFDNAPIGFLDLDSKGNNTINYETISGRKTYQVIAGDSWLDLIQSYTDLTGKQPLPPRWAFGNFSSRFGYHSEEETRATVQRFREEKIPLDAVVIDIYWFGPDIKGHMGNFEFYKDSFPTPSKMIQDFKEDGVKTILVTEPFILTTSKLWEEASSSGFLAKNKEGEAYTYDFYFGNTGLIDIYNAEAKNWFWDIYKKYTNMGIAGWWGDLGEPEVHPSDLIHETGTADEVHNIYGHDWARLIYEGYAKDFSNQRPFILMRAGYTGSQRFGFIPWSGDVSRSWGGLQAQPEIALQMGMQGLAYMHSDLGGFGGGEEIDSELYIRWMQYGVFQPIYRPHGQEHIPSEPVFHNNSTIKITKSAIELRYQMLPYNYTLAFENSQKGIPFMRPLFFEEFSNNKLLIDSESFLWGNEILVSPVMKKDQKDKQIYFPASNNWFDFYSDEKFEKRSTHKYPLHMENIPFFVRGGAFLPMVDVVQTTDDYSLDKFNLHFYYDEDVESSKGNLYNDDGETKNAFDKDLFEIISFESKLSNNKIEIQLDSEIGKNFIAKNKTINLVIHNIKKKPKLVSEKKYEWISEKNLLKISLNYVNRKHKITIKI